MNLAYSREIYMYVTYKVDEFGLLARNEQRADAQAHVEKTRLHKLEQACVAV